MNSEKKELQVAVVCLNAILLSQARIVLKFKNGGGERQNGKILYNRRLESSLASALRELCLMYDAVELVWSSYGEDTRAVVHTLHLIKGGKGSIYVYSIPRATKMQLLFLLELELEL
jgi:hypothetical protein